MMIRRTFLGKSWRGIAAVAVGATRAPAMETRIPSEPRESWLKNLAVAHKQFFDVPNVAAGAPLSRTATFLDAYRTDYGLRDEDLVAVFGAHGTALAIVLSDGLWSKYRLGEHYGITDSLTGEGATRNPFAHSGSGGQHPPVSALQARGVRFIACKQSIVRLARELAAKTGSGSSTIQGEIVRGLLSGVEPVPAMIVAVNRAQEAGLSYACLA